VTLLIALAALGWIATRLSLSGSASIKTQHVDLASSWRDTAHNVARIRLVATLLTVPAAVRPRKEPAAGTTSPRSGPLRRQHEFDRLPGRVDCAIQIHPFSCYLNVRLVDSPGPIRLAHLAANWLLKTGA
jgi:hypothetical protein